VIRVTDDATGTPSYVGGIDLIAADNPGSFIGDTPTVKLVRQVLGAMV
jgi:hypothetical protein